MSTPPPPPSFGYAPGTPTPAAPMVSDRRTLRAQRKAAAAQARWQRDQLRLRLRAARRTSIVGPFLLLVGGFTLLLLQTGRLQWISTFWWLGRWWPAALIAAGLVLVGEWALDRHNDVGLQAERNTRSGTLAVAPRRVLGGGAAFLLFLIAVVGLCSTAAQRSSGWLQDNLGENFQNNLDQTFSQGGFGDWRQLLGAHQEFTQNLQAPLAPAGDLTLNLERGDIVVSGSSQDNHVHAAVHQRLFAWQREDLEQRKQTEQARFSGGPQHLTFSLAGPDAADLNVELPHDASLTIHSGHGDIHIEELRGAITISAHEGDIELTALRGPVMLETQNDDTTVNAHSLSGSFTLNGRSGDIHLSDIEGPVTLHGDFFGDTQLERVSGPVQFQSSFTHFSCAAVPGDLNIEGRSDLEAHRLTGPLLIATTNRNLMLDGVRGATTIDDRNGSVNLTLAGPLQTIHVGNANGSIELAAADNAHFTLRAATSNGEIHNDFGLRSTSSDNTTETSGSVQGGGPKVDLQTSDGDITLHRSKLEDAPDWGDAPARLTRSPQTTKPIETTPADPPSED